LFLLILGSVLFSLNAGSVNEEPSVIRPASDVVVQLGDQIEITGRIKVKGSEPLTFTVLETVYGREYELSGMMVENLRRQFELKMVTLTGEVLSAGDDVRLPLVEVSSFEAVKGN